MQKLWKQYWTDGCLSPLKKGFPSGTHWKLSTEDEDYISMLVAANPTNYRSEIHDLLVENSNTINCRSDITYYNTNVLSNIV